MCVGWVFWQQKHGYEIWFTITTKIYDIYYIRLSYNASCCLGSVFSCLTLKASDFCPSLWHASSRHARSIWKGTKIPRFSRTCSFRDKDQLWCFDVSHHLQKNIKNCLSCNKHVHRFPLLNHKPPGIIISQPNWFKKKTCSKAGATFFDSTLATVHSQASLPTKGGRISQVFIFHIYSS